MRITEKHLGFIPNKHRIMTKYNLLYYFAQAITTGTFPTKFQRKRVCSQTIHRYEQEQWNIRMSLNTDFTLFKSVTSQCVDNCRGATWDLTIDEIPRQIVLF